MRDSELQDAIFRESVRQLERNPTTQGRGKKNPHILIERRAVGATHWQPYSAYYSIGKAEKALPKNTDNYEYRIRNGNHQT